MTGGNVCPKAQPLLEEDFRRVVSATLHRLLAGRKQGALAYVAGVEERTIANALHQRNSLGAKALLNLLLADATALDELLAHYGLKVVPADPASGSDHMQVMAGAAGFTSTVADALADGRIDHRERALIAENARPLHAQLGTLIAAHDRAKVN